MPASVLAAQLYTLRQFTKTPPEIAATFKRVKQLGYDAVQCSALGPIEPKELRKILDDTGLTCCATHVRRPDLAAEIDSVIEEHRILGCKYPALGGMPGQYVQRGKQGYLDFAREHSDIARKLKQGGLVWGYHNHSFELEKFDGKTGLDLLIENSDPALTFEIDTYWIQHGGGDPAAWIRKLKGRIPLVHLKDMIVAVDNTIPLPTRNTGESDADYAKRAAGARSKRPIMAEVGEGNMNFAEILKACKAAGVVWYIVEQDTCQRDPFECLKTSLMNLKHMGIS